MLAMTATAPPFTAAKAAMLPLPLAASPIDASLLVQLYTVPATAPVKFTAVVLAPLHTTWSAGSTTVGVGLTVIVKLSAVPLHPPNTGVTVIVATTGATPPFTAANAPILPVPEAASPIDGVSLIQLKVAPPVPTKFTAVVLAPLHTTWSAGSVTVAVGLTVIVNTSGVPLHPANTGVTVIVARTGTAPPFTAAKAAMLPLPLAARPIDGVSFVQL